MRKSIREWLVKAGHWVHDDTGSSIGLVEAEDGVHIEWPVSWLAYSVFYGITTLSRTNTPQHTNSLA